ncbi:MAG TPA: 23S rRNA (uracil(1939)-C(5))-methyltransferase RlmD, partial [Candidatus Acidoferrales bacterium]|nr:23S rRNA (uracil(1939)-C(5))-methyltransferase RlmD [Candidatus Acidoferrales bacterium]
LRLEAQRKKFARGRVETIVEASPGRVTPRCPYFMRCGGCHYQHLPYEAQLGYKKEILVETLSRLGGVRWEGPVEVHASPPFGYRNRAQWKVRYTGGDGVEIGYLEAGSHTLCAVDQCAILSPKLEDTLARVRGLLERGEIPTTLVEVEAFADGDDERLLLGASFSNLSGKTVEELGGRLKEAVPAIESLLLHDASRDRFELMGPGYLRYRVGERSYRVGHLSFFQVNRFLVEALGRRATADAGGRLALDLYAGVGFFSLPLAETFERVLAVEGNPAATRDLEENIQTAARGRGRVEARTHDAEDFLPRFRERADFILLDPPRAGMSDAVRERLAASGAPEIRYVSCDPATLARDLKGLSEAYEVTAVELFDLFPQSFHMETLVRLRRRERA